jgi:putative transposase
MIEQRDDTLSVGAMCEVPGVSTSGYYAWRNREPSQRQQEDQWLGEQVERVFDARCHTYGSDRIHQALRQEGIRTSRKRVARLMRESGLRSVRARQKRRGLTQAGNHAYIAPNRLQQDFTATARNEKWVTDTTYIVTKEGWSDSGLLRRIRTLGLQKTGDRPIMHSGFYQDDMLRLAALEDDVCLHGAVSCARTAHRQHN